MNITVGTRATFHLTCLVTRMVSLAGMALKFEAADVVTGVEVGGRACEGPLLPGEKREHVFTVRTAGGAEHELRRSWVRWCELAPTPEEGP